MQKKRPFETQLVSLTLAASVPLLLLLLWVMVYAEISVYLTLLVALVGGLLVAYTNAQVYQKSVYQFRSLSNLLDAMTHGDYSLRASSVDPNNKNKGALNELVVSINGLAQTLSKQKLESVESQILLTTVINHIDVAIVALNQANQISFLNPAAERLFENKSLKLCHKLLPQLAFVQSLSSGHHQVVDLTLGEQHGKFNLHIEEYRENGKQNKLVFLTDVRTLLRSEERKAWKNLVRVISHEINNSLSPIASLSQTMTRMIEKQGCGEVTENDLVEGLNIIAERANGLSTFVKSYNQIAKLPAPQKRTCSIAELVGNVIALFEKCTIIVEKHDDVELYLDPVQFEQVLINLIKNAEESMQQIESQEAINIHWTVSQQYLRLFICDHGIGISNSDNLFVPFYSTKQQGTGIGLVLCRQIIEAHNGQLMLSNRTNSKGCRAIIEIPMSH